MKKGSFFFQPAASSVLTCVRMCSCDGQLCMRPIDRLESTRRPFRLASLLAVTVALSYDIYVVCVVIRRIIAERFVPACPGCSAAQQARLGIESIGKLSELNTHRPTYTRTFTGAPSTAIPGSIDHLAGGGACVVNH